MVYSSDRRLRSDLAGRYVRLSMRKGEARHISRFCSADAMPRARAVGVDHFYPRVGGYRLSWAGRREVTLNRIAKAGALMTDENVEYPEALEVSAAGYD